MSPANRRNACARRLTTTEKAVTFVPAVMMDKRRGIQSIEIGFRLLDRLESATDSLSLTELARATGMSPSRVQFYLVSFLRVGIVAQEAPGGRYRLGALAIRLGITALSQMDVLEAARAKMRELRDETRDTVYVSVWGSHGPTVVNRLDGDKIAPLEVRVGAIVPLLESATGKTFLAYLPRAVTNDLLKREIAAHHKNGGKQLQKRDIERVVAEVKSRGLARTRRGVISGTVAIAAPIVDYEGGLRCVITLMGREAVLDIDYRGRTAGLLLKAAQSASRACGFKGDIWAGRTGTRAAD